MPYEEWAAKKITPAKVYAYLKRVLRKQTAKPEHSEIRLVKNNGSIYYKGYDRKTRAEAKEKSGKYAISDLIYHENYPFEDKRFEKYIQRKRRNFESVEKPMDEIEIDTDIKKYLDGELYNIIYSRYFLKMTQYELACSLNKSQSKISRLEKKALKKLKKNYLEKS